MASVTTNRACECEMCKLEIQHLRELLDSHKELDEFRHGAEQAAAALSSREVDRRMGVMNDFRTQIALERGNYVLRELHDRLESRMGEEVKSLDRGTDSRLKVLENLRSNLEGKIWMMGAAITGIMTFVQILLYVIHFYAYAATK